MGYIESEINICFVLSGKNVNLSAITEQLGVIPTKVRTLNDWPEVIKNPKIELPDIYKPCYIWEIITGYEKCRQLEDRFNILLEMLKGKEIVINDLKERFSLSATFVVGIHAQHEQYNLPDIFLTKKIITFSAAIGADIAFDLYLD
jgi:hypothetical protein